MTTSRFYRQVPEGTPGAEWAEGPGWIIFDEQARIEGQSAAVKTSLAYWASKREMALNDLRLAESMIAVLTRTNAD